jgi:aldehyde dehydrogenase (NAD+)
MKDISEETELLFAPATTTIRYEPYGVCGIYSAWNYPILTAFKPLVQAITCGNCVIMKPSEIAPSVSAVIKKLIDMYLDKEFIRCIEGGIDVAVELNKQKLDMICFTGSTFVGKIIAEVAAKNLTYCVLELGGKCPAVIHETTDMQHAVEKICWAKFSNSGQTCVAPDYVIVQESIVKEFVEQLKIKINQFWGEDTQSSD